MLQEILGIWSRIPPAKAFCQAASHSLNSESCEVSFIAKGFLSNRLITKVLYRCKQEMRLQTVCECVCVPFAMLTFNKNNLSLNLPLTRVVTGSTLSL